jgi:hypothetical protein
MAYVKNEKSNLKNCANALDFYCIMQYFDLTKTFDASCLGHALSKVW